MAALAENAVPVVDAGQGEYKKRVLQLWEPEKFSRLLHRRSDFVFVRNVEGEADNMVTTAKKVHAQTAAILAAWPLAPRDLEKDALPVLVLYMMENRAWSIQNDIVCTIITSIVLGDTARAHDDGVVRYNQGAFRPIEELPDNDLRKLESTLQLCTILMREVMNKNVEHDLAMVMTALQPLSRVMDRLDLTTSADHKKGKNEEYSVWALDAMKSMQSITPRFTSKQTSNQLVELVGTWLQQPKPEPAQWVIAFDDACVKLHLQKPGNERFENCEKTPRNNCYFFLPVQMSTKAPDWAIEEMQVFLTASYAGSAAAWGIEMSMESLAFMGQIMPPRQVLEYADGGNAKSARTSLRDNVWQGVHKAISQQAFQEPDEFRKHGG